MTQHTELFGALHAGWYDRWHHGKEYAAEVAQLRAIFAAEGPVESVLDLGCGTARHLELLAEAGHEVVGVDQAEGMVARARERLAPFGSRAEVVRADMLDVELGRQVDAVIMMFSVIGYLNTTERVLAALSTAHRHLRPGGLLVFDTFDAARVLRDGPSGGVTMIPDGSQTLIRQTAGRLHVKEQVYEIIMKLWLFDGDRLADHSEESHPMRFFLPRELDLILGLAGFERIGHAPLAGERQGPVREWLRLVSARKATGGAADG
jgi:SAM-dependent methyltransferase